MHENFKREARYQTSNKDTMVGTGGEKERLSPQTLPNPTPLILSLLLSILSPASPSSSPSHIPILRVSSPSSRHRSHFVSSMSSAISIGSHANSGNLEGVGVLLQIPGGTVSQKGWGGALGFHLEFTGG